MSKKKIIANVIINVIVFIVLNICFITSFIDNDKIYLLFGLLSLILLVFLFIMIRDYKYLTGKLSYSEFKLRSEYEYWFYVYGNKAYKMYLEKYK